MFVNCKIIIATKSAAVNNMTCIKYIKMGCMIISIKLFLAVNQFVIHTGYGYHLHLLLNASVWPYFDIRTVLLTYKSNVLVSLTNVYSNSIKRHTLLW